MAKAMMLCGFVLLAVILGTQAQEVTESPPDLYVNFERQFYSIVEDRYMNICIIITGEVIEEFTIDLHVETKDPFVQIYQTITIEVSVEVSRRFCFRIHLNDDDYFNMLEREADLVLVVNTNQPYHFGELYPAWLFLVDSSVVEIGFEEEIYTVNEGTVLHACVELKTNIYLAAPIVFRVYSQDGTAIAGEDYEMVNEVAAIASGGFVGSLGCVYIEILDDSFLEDPEYFTLHFFSYDHRIIINRAWATIRIIDEDVKVAFIDNTPLIDLTSLNLSLCFSPAPLYAECTVTRATGDDTQNCTGGFASFMLPTGTRPHDINVTAVFASGEVISLLDRRVRAETDRAICWAHAINDGVTVDGSTVIVEYQGTGPASNDAPRITDSECELFSEACPATGAPSSDNLLDIEPDCVIDSESGAGTATIENLGAGEYCLSIRSIDGECNRQIRFLQDIVVPDESA